MKVLHKSGEKYIIAHDGHIFHVSNNSIKDNHTIIGFYFDHREYMQQINLFSIYGQICKEAIQKAVEGESNYSEEAQELAYAWASTCTPIDSIAESTLATGRLVKRIRKMYGRLGAKFNKLNSEHLKLKREIAIEREEKRRRIGYTIPGY